MSALRILVLGASVAGLKAAARARRLLPDARVTVVDRRESVSFGASGLPAYLGGEVEHLDDLRQTSYGVVRDADFFQQTKDLEIRAGWRVVALDRDARAVTVQRTADGSERTMLMYDKLVYALGSRANVPVCFEAGAAVTCMTTPDEAAGLREGLQSGSVNSCVVIGGGCAGVEVAVAMADLWGCDVTICEAADHLLPRLLDRELSLLVAAQLQRAGVTVRTGCAVTGAVTGADGRAVLSTSTGPLMADRAVIALGTLPRTELARSAGLAVGALGGLVVDANLRTSDPDILAAGDCVELVNHASGEVCRMSLGSLACRQGRVAGDVLAGRTTEFPAIVGSFALKVLGLNVAGTGLTAAAARAAGLDPVVTWGAHDDRAGFQADRGLMHLALVHESGSDRLLGLQAVGAGDVVKRVDIVASLLRQDADLADLLDIECCYAPAYNAPLDPLHDLAAAACNVREAGLRQVPAAAVLGGDLLLDVRTAAEVQAAPSLLPPGTVHIPLAELRARVDELDHNRPVLITCAKGSRSYEAARILRDRGFQDVSYLAGGVVMRSESGVNID